MSECAKDILYVNPSPKVPASRIEHCALLFDQHNFKAAIKKYNAKEVARLLKSNDVDPSAKSNWAIKYETF